MAKKTSSTNSILLKLLVLIAVIIYFFSWLNKEEDLTTQSNGYNGELIVSKKCSRQVSYSKPEEFTRVLSLILQRHREKNAPQYTALKEMSNCLDIRYATLQESGVEGVFYFDETVSSPDRLVIEVDSSYSFTDDLTTALLLSHELAHARQFVETIEGVRNWGCVESEVDAFYSQLMFGAMLNNEEGDSLISRIEGGSKNSQLKQYENLIELSWEATQSCGFLKNEVATQEDIACYKKQLYKKIEFQIISSPYYQQQCGDEL